MARRGAWRPQDPVVAKQYPPGALTRASGPATLCRGPASHPRAPRRRTPSGTPKRALRGSVQPRFDAPPQGGAYFLPGMGLATSGVLPKPYNWNGFCGVWSEGIGASAGSGMTPNRIFDTRTLGLDPK